MTLVYEGAGRTEETVCDIQNVEDVWDAISDFLKKKNPVYEIPYTRLNFNRNDHFIMIDVGSHSEFFYLKGVPDEGFSKLLKR